MIARVDSSASLPLCCVNYVCVATAQAHRVSPPDACAAPSYTLRCPYLHTRKLPLSDSQTSCHGRESRQRGRAGHQGRTLNRIRADETMLRMLFAVLMTCTAGSPGSEPHFFAGPGSPCGASRGACAQRALPCVPRALHAAFAPLSVGRRSAPAHVCKWDRIHTHTHTHVHTHTCMHARVDARGLTVARPRSVLCSRVCSPCLVPECTATPERGQHGLDRRCRGVLCPCHVFLSCGG